MTVNSIGPRAYSQSPLPVSSTTTATRVATSTLQNPLYHSKTPITGLSFTYQVKTELDHPSVQEIQAKTGLVIPIPPGQETVENYILGRGEFAVFYVGTCLDTHEPVGIKIPTGGISSHEVDMQWKLRGLKHTLPAHDICATDGGGIVLIQPLAGLGSLQKIIPLLYNLTDVSFKEQLLYVLAKDLLEGLLEMHAQHCYHLDIKPDNLVVDHNGHLKIIDFGTTYHVPTGTLDLLKLKQRAGDYNYLPPEYLLADTVLDDSCPAAPIDAWSAGITLYQMAHGLLATPYLCKEIDAALQGQSQRSKVKQILSDYYHQHPLIPAPQQTLLQIIPFLLEQDPMQRISIQDALNHHWFQAMAEKTGKIAGQETKIRQALCELVQQARQDETVAPTSIQSMGGQNMGLSPQDLPFPHFQTYQSRTELEDKIRTKLSEPSAPTVCYGSGGTGKTQLAIYMLHDLRVKAHHGLRLWFRASDNIEYLKTQYVLLAQELKLIQDKEPFEKALPALHTYLAQQQQPWLIVYDNADDPATLAPFLPPSGGHVLITTRSDSWPHSLPIDVMSPEESITLIHHLLHTQDPDAGTLAQELGYLPLALVQACAYVRNEQLSLKTYLQKLQNTTALLQSDQTLFGKKLPTTVHALWQISLEKLQMSAPEALELLYALSLLAPDTIPLALLEQLGPEASQPLLRLSLLKQDGGVFSIHRLLQRVVRHQLTVQGHAVEQLNSVMEALTAIYDYTPATLEKIAQNKSLLPHGQQVLLHAESAALPPHATPGSPSNPSPHAKIPGKKPIKKQGEVQNVIRSEKGSPTQESALQAVPPPLCGAAAATLRWMAHIHETAGSYYLAEQLLSRGLELAEAAWGGEETRKTTSKAVVSKFFSNLRIIGQPQEEQRTTSEQIAPFLVSLGNVWQALGDAKKAVQYHGQALAIREKVYGREHPYVAASLNNLGTAWEALGDAKKAVQYYEQALAIKEKVYGREHPDVAGSLNNLGNAWKALGDAQKAVQYYEQALAIYEKVYGREHPDVAMSLNNLGIAWKALGDAKKAVQYYEQALAIYEKVYGREHPHVALSLYNMGLMSKGLGEWSRALELFKESHAIWDKVYGSDHPDTRDAQAQVQKCQEKMKGRFQ